MSETTERVSGGGGEAVVGTVLPEAQRRSVWPRAPAQRGRKRALEAEAGCWAEASGWRRPRLRPGRPPPEGRDKPDLLSDSRGWGKERGSVLLVCGREVHVLQKSARAAILRDLQWRRRREGRTLLSRGRGVPQYLYGSSLLPPVS